mgnify:CR=1 FL=1
MNGRPTRQRTSPGEGTAPFDVVGHRVLVGVQMVDISRLSAHPVPVTTGGLITVAGQGPKDSNGAGKSSFIAALSLLHADEQWRLAGGAPGAAELLFTAELAAQEGRWSNADRGYVVGVFADPRAGTVEELEAGALSVWLRINRKSPYLNLRWTAGLHVPAGDSEAERAATVDALWEALPTSNGRDDFHAGRLAGVLYGGHVRCVSFLSTSVRSSPTANLLAQPLNELGPARIFDAIATLTGLDRELETEQGLRSAEHAHRRDVEEAEAELTRWESEMAVVGASIARRTLAREILDTAAEHWRSRCARHLLDGLARVEEIRAETERADADEEATRERIAELRAEIETLADDDQLDDRLRETERRWREAFASDQTLATEHEVTVRRLEETDARHRDLALKAGEADGRTVELAGAEHREALDRVEAILGARGAAAAETERAAAALAMAETGRDLATDQLHRLAEAGVEATALLDAVLLDEPRRTVWEPRLVPYAGAVVVPASRADEARKVLADLPGSVVVLADDPERAGRVPEPGPAADGTGDLPASAVPELPVRSFLAALVARSGAAPEEIDTTAGVLSVGCFAEPIAGRAVRVAAAGQAQQAAAATIEALGEELADARARVDVAARRLDGAAAEREVSELAGRIREARTALEQMDAEREALAPRLAALHEEHLEALATAKARRARIENTRDLVRRAEGDLRTVQDRRIRLAGELAAVDLDERSSAWGGTVEDAERHLLGLDDAGQARTAGSWDAEVCQHLDDVARRCVPEPTPAEEMPAELRTLLLDRGWRRNGTLENRVALAGDLLRALRTHLALSERQDAHDREQIEQQRTHRTAALAEARRGLAESEETCRAHRASLALGIKAKLRRVAEEFDRLDQAYGGYGAGLDYPEPEPPSEPDKPWRWTVTPRWRRAEGQRMSSYSLRGNTALMDEKAVKLVCAAALAGGSDRPLLLVLDELGRNLGKQHRREAVALFERIGRDRGITVVGALQDDMERYAAEASNLYLKLRRSSDAMPYNEAPVIVGDDANRARVELLRTWLSSHHPAPGGRGDADDGTGCELPLAVPGSPEDRRPGEDGGPELAPGGGATVVTRD